jgi:hypothetical protein
MKITTIALAAAVFGATSSVALAQTAEQHNGPGGPRERVQNFVGQYGLTLQPAPPTPPSAPVSTTTVRSR